MGERMGYDPTAMLVYRAAYSLITANADDPAGKDGHFAWCAAALNRRDITTALLGLPSGQLLGARPVPAIKD
ncbi:hypothetical protein WEI85_04950 [Actinomycetes bacterium KLBMP 9797]